MLSPKVGKSRFGHLNSLLNSGLQSFSYRRNAAQLLGLKQQSSGMPKKQINVAYPFRYLNMPIEITQQQAINSLGDEGSGNEAELKMTAHTQKVNASSGALSYNNDQQPKSRGHTFDEVTGARLFPHSEDSASLTLSKNNANVPLKHLQNHLSEIDGKQFLKDFHGAKQAAHKEMDVVESLQPVIEANNPGIELLQTNVKSQQNNSDPSFIGKNLQSELNNRQKVNRDVNEVNEEYGLGIEHHHNSKQTLYVKNKTILNHQQLIQRYQTILEQGSAKSNFTVDEKTRTAMQRMQEKLVSVEETKAPQHKPADTIIDNKNIKANHLNVHDAKVFRAIQPLQQVLKNTLQTLPKKKDNSAKSHCEDSNMIAKIDHKLKDLTLQIEELNKINLSYRKKIANLESRLSSASSNNSRGGSSTNSDSFWERNRLTHALIRMRT